MNVSLSVIVNKVFYKIVIYNTIWGRLKLKLRAYLNFCNVGVHFLYMKPFKDANTYVLLHRLFYEKERNL